MTKARDIASAAPAPSTVSATELGYLDGVTSAIQTQLDAKTAKSTLTTTGDIYYASGANTPARLGIGSTGNVLTVASGVPSWVAPAGGGKVLQVVGVQTTTGTTISSGTYTDATNITATITPTLSTSKILVLISTSIRIERSSDYQMYGRVRLQRSSTTIAEYSDGFAVGDGATSNGQTVFMIASYAINYYDNPATTSAVTYKLQGNVPFGTMHFNYNATPTSITLLEIGA